MALVAFNGKLRRNLQNENFSKLPPKSTEESKWTAKTSNWTPITWSQALFEALIGSAKWESRFEMNRQIEAKFAKWEFFKTAPKVIRGVEMNRKKVELNSNNVIAGVIWRLSSRITVNWREICKMRIFQNCPQSHQRSRNEPQKRRIELQ